LNMCTLPQSLFSTLDKWSKAVVRKHEFWTTREGWRGPNFYL
jgi:hypothetical protein